MATALWNYSQIGNHGNYVTEHLSDQKPWQQCNIITLRLETMAIALQEHPWQQSYRTLLEKKPWQQRYGITLRLETMAIVLLHEHSSDWKSWERHYRTTLRLENVTTFRRAITCNCVKIDKRMFTIYKRSVTIVTLQKFCLFDVL